MSNENYPPGVFELPDDNVELVKHNFEVSGGFTVEIYENEEKKEYIENNIRDILHDAYKDGKLEINEY